MNLNSTASAVLRPARVPHEVPFICESKFYCFGGIETSGRLYTYIRSNGDTVNVLLAAAAYNFKNLRDTVSEQYFAKMGFLKGNYIPI